MKKLAFFVPVAFFAVSMIAVVVGYRFVIRVAYQDKEAFLAETA